MGAVEGWKPPCCQSPQSEMWFQFKMSSSRLVFQTFGMTILCLLILAIQSGTALKCWECNSKYDSRCGDPFSNYSVALVDCDQKHEDVGHLIEGFETDNKTGEPQAKFCRKTYQTVHDEIRIIRGCGWLPNTGLVKGRTCFNRAGTHQIQLLHCVCDTDGCNTASTMKLSNFFAMLIPLLPGLFML